MIASACLLRCILSTNTLICTIALPLDGSSLAFMGNGQSAALHLEPCTSLPHGWQVSLPRFDHRPMLVTHTCTNPKACRPADLLMACMALRPWSWAELAHVHAAMLTVEDPAFWEDLNPVRFGQLPKLQDAVVVIG